MRRSAAREASSPPAQKKGSAQLLLHGQKEVLALQVEDAAGVYIAEFECHHSSALPSDFCSAGGGVRS